MKDEEAITLGRAGRAEPIPAEDETPRMGRWYWVRHTDPHQGRWLGCVSHVGSNYAQLQGVGKHGWQRRVHFDEVTSELEPEPEAERYIAEQVTAHREEAHRLLDEVRRLTARLAVSHSGALTAAPETRALSLRDSSQPMEEYKAALTLAKEKTLPELFRQIEAENREMGSWMSASLIPLEAEAAAMKPAIRAIEARIFNVELYAGLVEEIKQVADGETAGVAEPVHLMQRRAYMDEECLARYTTGGMTFAHLSDFDAWISRPENRDRILPFPRCVIAFKVRREMREIDTPSLSAFITMFEEREWDKLTFLYLRNGDQVFRLRTKIDFGATLFPDLTQVDLGEPLYARIWGGHGRVENLISAREYEARRAQERADVAAWKKAPKKTRSIMEPRAETERDYYLFSPASVMYDDIAEHVEKEMARHNRLVLVIQGILDRSPVFHPHPPWQLWTQAGFERALRLIYDESRTLSAGDKPDFEAYRQRLNKKLRAGSVTVGQEDAWERREAARENARIDADWRERGDYRHKRFRPYGDPGPGGLARVLRYVWRTGLATYEWRRSRRREAWRARPVRDIRCTLTVESGSILNVDAYRPGDFKLFFNDPRTRADYLKWAPLLLEAEEWHAGNRTLEGD